MDQNSPETRPTEGVGSIQNETNSMVEAVAGDSRGASSLNGDERVVHDLEKADTQPTTQHGEPATRSLTAQDWTGPDDPENPMNWSLTKRTLHMIPIAFLAFAVTAGSSLITPATEEIAEHFQVSLTAAILPLSLFVSSSHQPPVRRHRLVR